MSDEESVDNPCPLPIINSPAIADEDESDYCSTVVSVNKNPIYDYFLIEGKDYRVCITCKTKISAKAGRPRLIIFNLLA